MDKNILFSVLILLLSSCCVFQNKNGRLLYKNIDFNFDNCCLATTIKGKGKIKVFDKMLEVSIKQGSIRLNPEFDNKTYTVGDISLSLGRYTKNRKWIPFNKGGNKIKLDETISSKQDPIDISGLVFKIPYNDKTDLMDSWIIIPI